MSGSPTGKHIVLGVSGGIAAYKTVQLARLLVKAGYTVQPVLTRAAHAFVSEIALATVCKRPCLTEFTRSEGQWNNHVELALAADLILLAPATANTIAHWANGICDSLLDAIYFSARCPVMISPAMDEDMYVHPAIAKNRETLAANGNLLLPVGVGELASGLSGPGRLLELEDIVAEVNTHFGQRQLFAVKNVLVTAGPTHEYIDPVRYIANASSGKMGYAIAGAFAKAGATVTLVSGPTALHKPAQVSVVDVVSAKDMLAVTLSHFEQADICIMAAAIADFTPADMASHKLKKSTAPPTLPLVPTMDVLATLGKAKRGDQVLIGFALETENLLENAQLKLQNKNLDAIVANSLADEGAGFGHDTNVVTILDRLGKSRSFDLKQKKEIAQILVQYVYDSFYAPHSS